MPQNKITKPVKEKGKHWNQILWYFLRFFTLNIEIIHTWMWARCRTSVSRWAPWWASRSTPWCWPHTVRCSPRAAGRSSAPGDTESSSQSGTQYGLRIVHTEQPCYRSGYVYGQKRYATHSAAQCPSKRSKVPPVNVTWVVRCEQTFSVVRNLADLCCHINPVGIKWLLQTYVVRGKVTFSIVSVVLLTAVGSGGQWSGDWGWVRGGYVVHGAGEGGQSTLELTLRPWTVDP